MRRYISLRRSTSAERSTLDWNVRAPPYAGFATECAHTHHILAGARRENQGNVFVFINSCVIQASTRVIQEINPFGRLPRSRGFGHECGWFSCLAWQLSSANGSAQRQSRLRLTAINVLNICCLKLISYLESLRRPRHGPRNIIGRFLWMHYRITPTVGISPDASHNKLG